MARLYYEKVLPLEEITLRTLVAHLWKGSIFDADERLRDVWDIFEGDVKEKVSKLNLPTSIRNRMLNLVKPIGEDLLKWQVFHENNFVYAGEVFNLHILQHLQRTCTGLIDYRRTAQELVRQEMFDVIKCFELSCLYCLEDIIPILCGELSEQDKENFIHNVSVSCTDVVRNYWAYILTGNESFLDWILIRQLRASSFYNVAFEFSALKGNKAGTEFFYQRLTAEEQESSSFLNVVAIVIRERFKIIDRTSLFFPTENVSDVLCYLLSVMTSEQQIQVLSQYTCQLLIGLLDWRLESIFVDIVDLCWSYLPVEEYRKLLYNMREVTINSGYYVPNMFQRFFLNSPREFRKRFVERECRRSRSMFSEFLRAEDTETIETIFRNIDPDDRLSLVSSKPVKKHLSHFILCGRWQVVEACFRAAMLRKENMQILESSLQFFVTNFSRGIPTEWQRQRLEEFFQFLNEMHASFANKRAIVAVDQKVKKLRSGEK